MKKMICSSGKWSLPLLMMGVALLMSSCGGKTTEQTVAKSLPEVIVETMSLEAVEQTFEYTGVIKPNIINMIGSQTSMRIEQFMVEVGDMVQKGQLLIKMEATNYLQTKLQLEQLKTDYQRAKTLYENGGASKQQIDQMETQIGVAEESLANLEMNTRLVSPVAGIVTRRMFDNGALTGGQPALEVQQINPVKIVINAEEGNFPAVKVGMPAQVRLDIYPEQVFTGKVSLIYPTINQVSHTFEVEIKIDNGNLKIRPGMFARVSLNYGVKDRVMVPDRAVIKQSGTNDRYVFTHNPDSTVSYKKITLGQRKTNHYEVLSGLEGGEQVVVAGQSRLVDGTKVTIKSDE
ncbi:MAG: efflux RND transporter periplasmic adaptor subunit [Bacteroidales bacterium]|nr:efflux RND transporter periplasmic adaptor subunit [Bacteroidales bacterium]MCL2132761.1 efflux RND transporter periplasmic adaptor subunit [Bacteroidales bacterium]